MNGALAISDMRTRPAPPVAPPAASAMDDLIVRIATSGDREAFATLYEAFAPRVKGYLLRIGVSGEMAEDIVQETMLRVWRRAKLFDPGKAAASTWIFTIARNLRIDAHRRLSAANLDPNDPSFLPQEEPRPDEHAARGERDSLIRKAFAELPPNQHKVVAMHFYEDQPHSAIAEKLGLPLGTVKSRLRLAFEKIRRTLGDQQDLSL